MANRRNVIGQDYDPGLLGPILHYLATHPEKVSGHTGIHIYLLIYQSLIEPDEERHFQQLSQLFRIEAPNIPIAERREIYTYALNFCIQQINRGKALYLEILLDLYQRALDDETLLNEGWLSQWDYKNIVSAGLKAGRFEWTEKFIEGYKGKVEPSARENAYTYNLASLHYEQGNYSQALKLLQHVEFSDVFYHLGSKVILLKSYYELADIEALMHLCETFRMYLKRNTDLSKYHQTTNMNLIALTRKLADVQSRWPDLGRKERDVQMEKMRAAIAEKGNVAQKSWVVAKVEDLAGRL
jgi:tetratricopeptide (TPR) repeat protein